MPSCGAVQYDQYFPTEDWRAGHGTKGTDTYVPSPLVVCRVGGHQEQAGGIIRFRRADSADEDEVARAARMARVRAEQAKQRWYSNQITLMAVTFPIYAVEGWLARINESGTYGDDLTHLVIGHAATLPDTMFIQRPRIETTTSIDPYQPGELAIARDTFAQGIEADSNRRPTDGLSDAALMLWSRAARRRRVAESHEAPVSETEITIDRVRKPFVTVGVPNARWVAVRRHHDVTITIAARERPGIADHRADRIQLPASSVRSPTSCESLPARLEDQTARSTAAIRSPWNPGQFKITPSSDPGAWPATNPTALFAGGRGSRGGGSAGGGCN